MTHCIVFLVSYSAINRHHQQYGQNGDSDGAKRKTILCCRVDGLEGCNRERKRERERESCLLEQAVSCSFLGIAVVVAAVVVVVVGGGGGGVDVAVVADAVAAAVGVIAINCHREYQK